LIKMHPLYGLGLALFLAVVAAVSDFRLERECFRLQHLNLETEATGKTLSQLKAAWKDSKRDRSDIDAVLNQRDVKAHIKSKTADRGVYRIEATELGPKELDTMLGKLLNESVSIKKLELQRNGDTNVSAVMEFTL